MLILELFFHEMGGPSAHHRDMDPMSVRDSVQAELDDLIDVATGTSISERNDRYRTRRSALRMALRELGITDPNEWPDLWLWYETYRGLPGYQDRRVFALRTYQPLFEALDELEARQVGEAVDDRLTGWSRVDEKKGQLKEKFKAANTVEDFQGVGLICRSLMLAISDAIFDPARHDHPAGEALKRGDTKNRIDRVLSVDFSGEDSQLLRRTVRATNAYIHHVVHAETSDAVRAGIAADGTVFLINTLRRLIPEPVRAEPEPEVEDLWADYEPDPEELAALQSDYDEEWSPTEPPEEYLSDFMQPPPEWRGRRLVIE
jgi:hypothetical protein